MKGRARQEPLLGWVSFCPPDSGEEEADARSTAGTIPDGRFSCNRLPGPLICGHAYRCNAITHACPGSRPGRRAHRPAGAGRHPRSALPASGKAAAPAPLPCRSAPFGRSVQSGHVKMDTAPIAHQGCAARGLRGGRATRIPAPRGGHVARARIGALAAGGGQEAPPPPGAPHRPDRRPRRPAGSPIEAPGGSTPVDMTAKALSARWDSNPCPQGQQGLALLWLGCVAVSGAAGSAGRWPRAARRPGQRRGEGGGARHAGRDGSCGGCGRWRRGSPRWRPWRGRGGHSG